MFSHATDPAAAGSTSPGLRLLNHIIDARTSELAQYAQRPGARQPYLDRGNDHLRALHSAALQLSRELGDGCSTALAHAPLWQAADRALQELLLADPRLDGLHLILRLRPCGHRFGFVNLNA